MPLSDLQYRIAQTPFQQSKQDIFDIMTILGSEPEEYLRYGDGSYSVVMLLYKVAVTQLINIPRRFQDLVDLLQIQFKGRSARLDYSYVWKSEFNKKWGDR